jgi:hypothetical protein
MMRFHPQSHAVALEIRHFPWVISWAGFVDLIIKQEDSAGMA